MPNPGRPRNTTLEDKIAATQARIDKLTKQLREEKRRLTELQTRKKMRDQQAIIDAFSATGKSLEEICEIIEAQK